MPTIRGSAIQSTNAISFDVAFPSGTVAGDLVVVFVGAAFAPGNADGTWTLVAAAGPPITWNGKVWYKVVDSGDISTGYTTISQSGSFQTVIGIVSFVGNPGFRAATGVRVADPSDPPSLVITSDSSPVAGDLCIYFGSIRLSSTVTCTSGSSLQTVTQANGSGCLFSEAVASSGVVTRTGAYSPDTNTAYQAIFVAGGAGGGGGSAMPPIVHHLRQQGIM